MHEVIRRDRPRAMPGLSRAGRFLWETFWLPYWLGSGQPPPRLPGFPARGRPGGRTPALLRQLDALRGAVWRRRAATLAWRCGWLALAALDLWLGLRVLAHRDAALGPFLVAALVILALGAFLVSTARPGRGELARALDRSFGLRERVATALEQAERGRLTGLRALQVLDATRVTGEVSGARAFRRPLPAREVALFVALAILCAVLLGLFVFRDHGRPATTMPPAASLPGLARGAQAGGLAAQTQGNQPGNQQGQQSAGGAQQDLNALASALQGHDATQAAANALQSGDYSGAANALRQAGQNAGNMSQAERDALANDLRSGAAQAGDPNGQIARDMRAAANALQQPGAAGAQQAFNALAGDVQQAGQGNQRGQPQSAPSGSPGQGKGQSLPSGQKSQPAPGQSTPLLGADGQPVQLPSGPDQGQQITTPNSNAGGGQSLPGATTAGGGELSQGTIGPAGTDPNRVPDGQRQAVQQYFTPDPSRK